MYRHRHQLCRNQHCHHGRPIRRLLLLWWWWYCCSSCFYYYNYNSIGCDAKPLLPELSDPALQPKFQVRAPNPLDPNFHYNNTQSGYVEVGVGPGLTRTGLVGTDGRTKLFTPIWGYGSSNIDGGGGGYTWPGRTFTVQRGTTLRVRWLNEIPIENGYLITGVGDYTGRSVVDTTIHWAYTTTTTTTTHHSNAMHNSHYTIEQDGTPIVVHLHGGDTDSAYDAHPEAFFSPNFAITGPQWVDEVYIYENNVPANNLWYHDHALGLTRLNVYCGMAGFYFIRDQWDTGLPDNPLSLPAFPYEIALAIQDRMFKNNGELFYPAFPGDPTYDDFIVGEEAQLHPTEFPGGGPTALAEFFGDHMLVNGKIWPKFNVEPRKYRLRMLNGCDSRFLVVEFWAVELGQVKLQGPSRSLVEFFLIGGGQGLAERAERKTRMVLSPGDRLDVIVDFSPYRGQRIIQANLGGDSPFGGEIPGEKEFSDTDKIVAFDVTEPLDNSVADNYQPDLTRRWPSNYPSPNRVRRLGLFEGKDQFGRLQPLLGTVEPATDKDGNPIYWPNTPPYVAAGLAGTQMSGTMTWSDPITEHINLNDVEEWEIFNLSADAHPIHLHLVSFEILERRRIVFDSAAKEEGELEGHHEPAGDGTYLKERRNVGHDGSLGSGYTVFNPTVGAVVTAPSVYTDTVPTDTVVALPGQVVRIRAQFNRLGRFTWHCHILSHEDHEMMREFLVGGNLSDNNGHHGGGVSMPILSVPPPPPAPAPPSSPTASTQLTCAVLKTCALVNLDRPNDDEIVLTGDDSYRMDYDSAGYTIRCDVEGPVRRFRFASNVQRRKNGGGPTATRRQFRFGNNNNGRSMIDEAVVDRSSSFWMAGGTSLQPVPFLKRCGSKVITVSATNTMSELCFTHTFQLEAMCDKRYSTLRGNRVLKK